MKVRAYDDAWRERVLAFRARQYPDNPLGHTPGHFDRRFLGHPLLPDPVYLLAVDGDRIVGQWAGLRDRLWVDGQVVDGTWLVDLMVAPEARDTMAAMALFRAAQGLDHPVLATGATTQVVPFYTGFRWQRLALSETLYAVFRPAALMALAGDSADAHPLHRVAHAVGAGPAAAWRARLAWRRAHGQVVPLAGFGPATDALFHRVRDQVGVISDRSAAVLQWRFGPQATGHHQTLALPDDRGGLRGLLILKLRHRPGCARWAEVADVLVPPDDPDAFERLCLAAVAAALAQGLDFVRLRASIPAHLARLPAPWWQRRGRYPQDDVFIGPGPRSAPLLQARPWYTTSCHSDVVDTGLDEWPS